MSQILKKASSGPPPQYWRGCSTLDIDLEKASSGPPPQYWWGRSTLNTELERRQVLRNFLIKLEHHYIHLPEVHYTSRGEENYSIFSTHEGERESARFLSYLIFSRLVRFVGASRVGQNRQHQSCQVRRRTNRGRQLGRRLLSKLRHYDNVIIAVVSFVLPYITRKISRYH